MSSRTVSLRGSAAGDYDHVKRGNEHQGTKSNDDYEANAKKPSSKRRRVDDDQRLTGIHIGHHIDVPELRVYATMTKTDGSLECRIYKEQAPFRVQLSWSKFVSSSKGIIAVGKVVLIEEILEGRRQQDYGRKDLSLMVKDYLRSKLGSVDDESPGDEETTTEMRSSLARLGSMDDPSTRTVKIQESVAKLQAAQGHLKDSLQIHNDIQEVIESQTEELESLRNTIRKHEDTIKGHEDTIEDLAAQLSNAATASHTCDSSSSMPEQSQIAIPKGPSKTSSGKFVIGDKVCARIPAGSINEGVYIEKEGRIKNGYQEKTVLSEYSRYEISGVTEIETVMLKNAEYYRTSTGDLVQKQEEVVEIDGKTYVRRRLHVAYDSDDD